MFLDFAIRNLDTCSAYNLQLYRIVDANELLDDNFMLPCYVDVRAESTPSCFWKGSAVEKESKKRKRPDTPGIPAQQHRPRQRTGRGRGRGNLRDGDPEHDQEGNQEPEILEQLELEDGSVCESEDNLEDDDVEDIDDIVERICAGMEAVEAENDDAVVGDHDTEDDDVSDSDKFNQNALAFDDLLAEAEGFVLPDFGESGPLDHAQHDIPSDDVSKHDVPVHPAAESDSDSSSSSGSSSSSSSSSSPSSAPKAAPARARAPEGPDENPPEFRDLSVINIWQTIYRVGIKINKI